MDTQYATLLVAQWDPGSRRLLFANAGAEPPLVCRGTEILKPKVEGVPIGLLEDREYEEVEFVLQRGDTAVFYSDGVEDQVDEAGEDYTRARLGRLLVKHCHESPQEIADAVIQDLDRFRDGTPITDDQTVVVVNVLE